MTCDHCGQQYPEADGGVTIDFGDECLHFCGPDCVEAAVAKGSVKGHDFHRWEMPEAQAAHLKPGDLLKVQ